MTKKQTYKIENGQQQNLGTEREVHELLVHPDVIKNLGDWSVCASSDKALAELIW